MSHAAFFCTNIISHGKLVSGLLILAEESGMVYGMHDTPQYQSRILCITRLRRLRPAHPFQPKWKNLIGKSPPSQQPTHANIPRCLKLGYIARQHEHELTHTLNGVIE